jgi:hypothetical protein
LSADIASVSFALGPEIARIRMGLCQVRGQARDRSCAAASTLPAARAAVADIVSSGRGDGPRWNAADLLATLGVDLPAIQRQMRADYGPHAIAELYRSPIGRHLSWGRCAGRRWHPD